MSTRLDGGTHLKEKRLNPGGDAHSKQSAPLGGGVHPKHPPPGWRCSTQKAPVQKEALPQATPPPQKHVHPKKRAPSPLLPTKDNLAYYLRIDLYQYYMFLSR